MKKLVVLSALSIFAAVQLNANQDCGVTEGPVIRGQTFTVPDKQCPACPICPKTRCDVVQGSCTYHPARAVQEEYCAEKSCHVCHKPCHVRHHGCKHGCHAVEAGVVSEQAPARAKRSSAGVQKAKAGVQKTGAAAGN